MVRIFKLIVAAVVGFSGTLLCISWSEAAALAKEVPICFMTKPTTEVIDLTEMCSRKNEQHLPLSVEKQLEYLYEQTASLSQQGHLKKAVDKLTQVINIEPKSPSVYVNRGNLRLEARDLQGAVEDFQKASELYRANDNLESSSVLQQQISKIRKNF